MFFSLGQSKNKFPQMQFTYNLFIYLKILQWIFESLQTLLPEMKYLLLNKDLFNLPKNVWLKLPNVG